MWGALTDAREWGHLRGVRGPGEGRKALVEIGDCEAVGGVRVALGVHAVDAVFVGVAGVLGADMK